MRAWYEQQADKLGLELSILLATEKGRKQAGCVVGIVIVFHLIAFAFRLAT